MTHRTRIGRQLALAAATVTLPAVALGAPAAEAVTIVTISPTAALQQQANGVVVVSGYLQCAPDTTVRIAVAATQRLGATGGASKNDPAGTGAQENVACTNEIYRWSVAVSAIGKHGFSPGKDAQVTVRVTDLGTGHSVGESRTVRVERVR